MAPAIIDRADMSCAPALQRGCSSCKTRAQQKVIAFATMAQQLVQSHAALTGMDLDGADANFLYSGLGVLAGAAPDPTPAGSC
jgi:hypothetical protein